MAFDAVEEVLAAYPWLADLGKEVYDVIVEGITNAEPAGIIIQNVRSTDTYKKRFAGLIARQNQGLPPMTEYQYLQYEEGIYSQLRNYNLLGTLGLDSTERFREFAAEMSAGDVAVQELNARLDRAVALSRDSSEFVQEQFERFYGIRVTEDALLTYFLDPDLGLDIIQDQIATATIGGEAFRYGLNISRTRADILRREGVTGDIARQGFADIAREEPVLQRLAEIHNLTPLSQTELEEFFFHEDPDVASRRARTFQTALAAFQTGGARNVTREGGLGELADRSRAI